MLHTCLVSGLHLGKVFLEGFISVPLLGFGALADDLYPFDAIALVDGFYPLHVFLGANQTTEYGKAASVQMGRFPHRDVELRAVGSGIGIGHGDDSGGVFDGIDQFYREEIPGITGTGTGGVAALDDKAGLHPVEGERIVKAFAFVGGIDLALHGAFGQGDEIAGGHRDFLVVKAHEDFLAFFGLDGGVDTVREVFVAVAREERQGEGGKSENLFQVHFFQCGFDGYRSVKVQKYSVCAVPLPEERTKKDGY